jgi:histidinol-phosphate aminotransferase
MISEKKSLSTLNRPEQEYSTRFGLVRLGFNEYVPHVEEAFYQRLLNRVTPEIISAYPEVNGAYEAISAVYGMSEENFLFTYGVDGAIKTVFETFCDDGTKVGLICPTYGMYECYIKMLGCIPKIVSYDANGNLSEDEVYLLIRSGIKILAITSPNGIWGSIIERKFLLNIIIECNKLDVVVLLDEVYSDFSGISYAKNVVEYKNLIVAKGFSKTLGLAGLRIGFCISDASIREKLNKVRPNVEMSSIAVEAVKLICEDYSIIERSIAVIKKSKKFCCDLLNANGFIANDTEANFIILRHESIKLSEIYDICGTNKIELKYYEAYQFLRMTVGSIEYMRSPLEKIITWTKQK